MRPEDTQCIDDVRNENKEAADRNLGGFAALMDEAAGLLEQLDERTCERLQMRVWLPDELRGSAVMLRDAAKSHNAGIQRRCAAGGTPDCNDLLAANGRKHNETDR